MKFSRTSRLRKQDTFLHFVSPHRILRSLIISLFLSLKTQTGHISVDLFPLDLVLGCVSKEVFVILCNNLHLHVQRPRKRRRALNPAFAASSLAPTSFVAPSQYYKLRGVQGVSGGRFADDPIEEFPSLTDSINSRVIGSRFQEVNRNSAYGLLPLGSRVHVEKSGELGPSTPEFPTFPIPQIPDPRRYGPNHMLETTTETEYETPNEEEALNDEWVDVTQGGRPSEFESDYNGTPPSSSKRRPEKEPLSSSRRETFPFRSNRNGRSQAEGEEVLPPHLRLQPSQPFVRPMSGINHDDLGVVYGDIRQWRSKLKVINAEIAEVQRECYNDIADGSRIKGWLLVGRGLRFIPGVELIEGRAKEDIRWDVLQNERSVLDSIILWAVIVVVTVLLAAGCESTIWITHCLYLYLIDLIVTAASGLALGTAPDVAHFLPFLAPLTGSNALASGIATVLCPALAATIFIVLALTIINCKPFLSKYILE